MSHRLLLYGALIVGLGAAASCRSNPYCLTCGTGMNSIDGMDTDSGAGDLAGADLAGADLSGGSDLDVCDPTRLMDDANHCGSCDVVCPRAHAVPSCIAGKCQVNCDVGWVNLDGQIANDCEYPCLISGAEICDGLDNDCNGAIDEIFDTQVDPLNCGTCGKVCSVINGVATCVGGACKTGGCLSGYADLDPAQPGCEYRCPVFPPLNFEICNGLDDNCDDLVDEPSHLEAVPVGLCNTLAGSPCAGTTATCQKRNAITTWYCNYGAGVEFDPSLPNGIALAEAKCDGIDGDCNGTADDTFGGLGASCDNGLKGACRDGGLIKCDPADATKTYCDLSVAPDPVPGAPLVELCNNMDDDCDGVIDNKTGPKRLVQDMVRVQANGLDFYIDRYEASRPDAKVGTAGVVQTRSCSNAGVLPWTQVPFVTAQAACTAAGLRLCTANEWNTACAGAAALVYPYGNTYQGATCNGADFATPHAILPTGDPTLSMCLAPGGTHDLSGNVKEWTNDQQGVTSGAMPQPIYVVRGGGYGSPSLGLTCATTFSRASADTTLADLGFRCCSTTAP